MADSQLPLLITVDRSKCCGYTLCAAEGPDVYSIDDAGYAEAPESVPANLEAQACRGAEACPDSAITVRRANPGE
ncbi:ferredoxin [Mycobacterium vulneris]|jgi:ferredoxin|uniref:Ferredoxin n=1 Tax=Mycolicibacterium vulneris TaxID=547163 RepID=A0A1X2KZA5_9MYCO|nr:ferredoxin [Mycolicibacterium vulneris]OSC27068.1 ferredoxin [Mycolicibacterium vulneris]